MNAINKLDEANRLGHETVTLTIEEANALLEEHKAEEIIDDTRLYIDYVETLAKQLETTFSVASKLVDEDTMEEVITDMFQAETDHINLNIDRYEKILNRSK